MPPACQAAFSMASRAAAISASGTTAGAVPTVTTSNCTGKSASISPTMRRSAAGRSIGASAGAKVPEVSAGSAGRAPRAPAPCTPVNNHSRSSRSWARARRAASLCGPAFCWISARVCSTESWRCAAISARSDSRIRSERSSARSRDSLTSHGAITTITPSSTETDATTTVHPPCWSPVTKNSRMPTATSNRAPSARTSSAEESLRAPTRMSANCRQARATPASTTIPGITTASGTFRPSRLAARAVPAASRARPRRISVTGAARAAVASADPTDAAPPETCPSTSGPPRSGTLSPPTRPGAAAGRARLAFGRAPERGGVSGMVTQSQA